MVYKFESPKTEELSPRQRQYIQNKIDSLESAFVSGSFSYVSRLVDIYSMIDYQLLTEFAQNLDGYDMSNFIYKRSNDSDSLFHFVLWDFDHAYITPSQTNRIRKWMFPNRQKLNQESADFWWLRMMKDPFYYDCLCKRWEQYRQKEFTSKYIHHVIDSLANVLTSHQAVYRNAKAWNKLWGTDWRGPLERWPENVVSANYDEEIEILKEWIDRRIEWMDEELKKNLAH